MSTEDASVPRTIKVLHSVAAPTATTKFINQLADGAPPLLELKYFSWSTAFKGNYDVFHVHWPEYLMRGSSFLGRLRQRIRFLRLLSHLKSKRIPLVRTLHNLEPHERGSWVERRLLALCDSRTDLFVLLNPATVSPMNKPSVVILHGHYRHRFAQYPHEKPNDQLLLNFGLIRPYKGIEDLLELFRGWTNHDVNLRIVGKPIDPSLAQQISGAVDVDRRITCELRFVDDAELVREVTSAEIVILPYREMHNSGTLLVALSLNRPVIVPWSESNDAISKEIGSGWIFQYEGTLTHQFIEGVLDSIRTRTGFISPDLALRDWSHVGELHYRAYSSLLSR